MQITNRLIEVKSLHWLVKLLGTMCLVLLISNLSTICLLYVLLPLKEISPFLVQISPKSEQVITVKPLNLSVKSSHLLIEQFSRQYVELRETIDFHTEPDRWHKLSFFHNEELQISFHELMKINNKDSPLVKFQERGVNRDIHIIASSNLAPTSPNIWQIEWEALDCDVKKRQVINKQIFVSTITVDLLEQKVINDVKFINPIGFTVTNYTVSLKNIRRDNHEE